MALQGQTVDVPLGTMRQKLPATAGPIGRLKSVENGVCLKFAKGEAEAYRVEKRAGFSAMSTTVRDQTGAVSSTPFSQPEVLAAYGDQLIAVGQERAYVRAAGASAWVTPGYGVFQSPTQTVANVRNTVLQAPDSAVCGTSVASIWHEVGQGVIFSIADLNGTVLLHPNLVSVGIVGKVISDGTRFWTATYASGTTRIAAYSTLGAQLGATTITGTLPFDVMPLAGGGIVLAQPATNVEFHSFTWTGSAIAHASTSLNLGTIQGLGWLTNDTADGRYYLATIPGTGPTAVTAYKLSAAFAVVSQTTVIGTSLPIGNVAGKVDAGSGSVTLFVSQLDDGVTPNALKNSSSHVVAPFGGGAATVTAAPSIVGVSRAFRIGSHYVCICYYGVGLVPGQMMVMPAWFLYDLELKQVAGQWELGTAYADWNVDSNTDHRFQLASVTAVSDGRLIGALPYRAESFTAQQRGSGDVAPYYQAPKNTIGLKLFTWKGWGQAAQYAGELLLPGTCADFSGQSFSEQGLPLPPAILSILDISTGSLTSFGKYIYQAVYEFTDTNGNRLRSIPSPPVSLTLGSGKNSLQLTGTMACTTTKNLVTVALYRTIYVNGVPSTTKYKVTDDLAPLYSNPGTLTWSFTDSMSDAAASTAEQLYTDLGYTDRFPGPAFSTGCAWQNRLWLAGYDNAVWFSGEKTEGDGLWFSPAFRVIMPTTDAITALVPLDNMLLVFCARSTWYIQAAGLPGPNLASGTIPTPVQLPGANGCTGTWCATRDGIMFASSAGGVWLITRDLRTIYLSADIEDDLAGRTITGMAIDSSERVLVVYGINTVAVWDTIAQAWYRWRLSTAAMTCASLSGAFVYGDGSRTWVQTPGQFYDLDALGTQLPIVTTVTVAPVRLAGVRAYKRVWNIQLVGEWLGDHDLTVTLTYDIDDNPVTSTVYTLTPASSAPYVQELPPAVELCTSVGFTVADSFPRGASRGAAWEVLSLYVGVERGLGRVPTARRRPPT